MPSWNQTIDTFRSPRANYSGVGMTLCSVNMEIYNIQNNYFRKNTSVWQLMAYVGGFAVTSIYIGQAVYVFIKQNSQYMLS